MERVTANKSNKPMSQSLKDAQKRYYEKINLKKLKNVWITIKCTAMLQERHKQNIMKKPKTI